MLKEDIGRNTCPMAQIISTKPNLHGIVQSFQLKVIGTTNNNKLFRRPISKIVLLEEDDHVLTPNEGRHVV